MRMDPVALLREHRISVTAQRVAVLRVVHREPHITADEVIRQVRDEIGAISRQSVYDTLNLLSDRGLLRRIQPMGSAARFEDRTGDNHHHLVCRLCGRVIDVDCAVGARPCLTAADDHDFEIDEAEVLYWGRCPDCRASRPSSSHRSTSNTNNTNNTSDTSDTSKGAS